MIEINGITKRYGKKLAADHVTFTVGAGEIMGFLGPNGAGKSTTMNILTGYLSATEGTAKIDGIDIFENPIEAKSKIGFLPEHPPLYLDLTVNEYLNFVYELKKPRMDREKHLKEICDVVKISDVRDRVIGNLSKGYRQRVGIAQALIGNPPVLIFDEPTVGLDPKQIIEIRNLIKKLGKEHTIILSTHILSEVQAICDRIVVINNGRIVADEKTENIARAVEDKSRMTYHICGPQNEVLKVIKSTPGVVYAEVIGARDNDSTAYMIESADNIDVRKPLFYAMAEKRWPIIAMDVMGMDLEDVFLALITEKKINKPKKGGK
ncbi:MAG: ATP-binding cassette domain-containing protein [Ruminococcaceae bacterium]|nr:ATP-binding cassette domain-containing protein [Oscillospiraceae bacterium]